MNDWRASLAAASSGRVAVVCVGNRIRGDDAAGPALADRLHLAGTWKVFDCGVAPENWIGPICSFQPDAVVLVDAIDFGASAGAIRCWQPDDLAQVGISTHRASLSLLLRVITERTGARAIVVGIQPGSAALMQQALSPPVAAAVEQLEGELTRLHEARSGGNAPAAQ